MRICDRCGKKQIKKILQDKQEFTEFDLCIECCDDFLLFLAEKKENHFKETLRNTLKKEETKCPAQKKEKRVKKATKPNK